MHIPEIYLEFPHESCKHLSINLCQSNQHEKTYLSGLLAYNPLELVTKHF